MAAHITLISISWSQRETEIPLVPQSTEDARKNIPAKSNLCLRTRRRIVADSQAPQNQRGSTREADTLFKIQLTAFLFDKVFSSSSIRWPWISTAKGSGSWRTFKWCTEHLFSTHVFSLPTCLYTTAAFLSYLSIRLYFVLFLHHLCWRFLPIKIEFFLPNITKSLLIGFLTNTLLSLVATVVVIWCYAKRILNPCFVYRAAAYTH